MGQRVYVGAHAQINFFAYDNNVYGIASYRPMADTVQVVVRGACKGLRDIETGRTFTEFRTLPKPGKKGDATSVIPEETEYAFDVPLFPGPHAVLRGPGLKKRAGPAFCPALHRRNRTLARS